MNSTNIKVMSEEIQHLKDEVHNLDVEIPSHDSGDAGKYLGVDSSGDLEFSDPLPAKTEAATGDVLGLTGEGKVPGWITPYTPKDYSTNETNTGVKWTDGKDIYRKTFVIDPDHEATSPARKTVSISDLSIDNIIDISGIAFGITIGSSLFNFTISTFYSTTIASRVYFNDAKTSITHYLSWTEGYYEGAVITILYTKTQTPGNREPDEEPETKKVTRKKSTK